MLRRLVILGGVLASALALLWGALSAASLASAAAGAGLRADGPAAAPAVPTATLNCRLGYATTQWPITYYATADLARLNAGHYVAFMARRNPPRPTGLEYIQMARVHQLKACPEYNCPYVEPYTYTVYPDRATIALIAQSNPGSLWLLGNEIDRRDWVDSGGNTATQDEMLPEVYAQAFHELRQVVKTADPTARIALAAVIQATPLRLEYLDRMWNEYVRLYGTAMPVDVWNVHGFITREKRYYPGCPDCWGADVPPGIDVPFGELYGVQDTINLSLYIEHIVAFRQWMAEKGQRDKPLIVSEYAVFPLDYYQPGEGVTYILSGTFEYLRTATDAQIGYPGDENRLVQRWVYYSLDDDVNAAPLFDPNTRALAEMGRAWVAYVADPAHGLAQLGVNLLPGGLHTDPAVLYSPDGGGVDATLYPEVSNSGNVSTALGFGVSLVDTQWPLQGVSQVGWLAGCGQRVTGSGVTFYDMVPGIHTVTVQVDPGNVIAETNESDNTRQVRLLVATHRVLAPVMAWGTP